MFQTESAVQADSWDVSFHEEQPVTGPPAWPGPAQPTSEATQTQSRSIRNQLWRGGCRPSGHGRCLGREGCLSARATLFPSPTPAPRVRKGGSLSPLREAEVNSKSTGHLGPENFSREGRKNPDCHMEENPKMACKFSQFSSVQSLSHVRIFPTP